LESSAEPNGVVWEPVAGSPAVVGGRWKVNLTELTGRRFYRLAKF